MEQTPGKDAARPAAWNLPASPRTEEAYILFL
jgi:hypothetical protein